VVAIVEFFTCFLFLPRGVVVALLVVADFLVSVAFLLLLELTPSVLNEEVDKEKVDKEEVLVVHSE
jgi:hypothetical protein